MPGVVSNTLFSCTLFCTRSCVDSYWNRCLSVGFKFKSVFLNTLQRAIMFSLELRQLVCKESTSFLTRVLWTDFALYKGAVHLIDSSNFWAWLDSKSLSSTTTAPFINYCNSEWVWFITYSVHELYHSLVMIPDFLRSISAFFNN